MDRWENFFEYYSDMIRTILKILATNITGAIKKIKTICRYSYTTTKKH